MVSVGINWSAAKTNDRSIHIAILMIVSSIGNAIAIGTTSFASRYFAMFLIPVGVISAYTVLVSWISSSFPLPDIKRSSAIAIINCIGNTATIYGSYMYDKSTAPQYIPGGSAVAVVCVVTAALAIVVRYVHIWENNKIEKAEKEAEGSEEGVTAQVSTWGITPPGFRYIY